MWSQERDYIPEPVEYAEQVLLTCGHKITCFKSGAQFYLWHRVNF